MNDQQAIDLLKELCATYSPSGEERPAVHLMVAAARAAGMEASADGAGNFVAETGSGRRTILFLGHIDTVRGFIPVRVESGNLYGRGSVDAKGPLAAFFVAVARRMPVHEARVVVIGAVEEEAPTSKGARYVVDRYRPDYVIVGEPSGIAGITLGYKGRIHLKYDADKPHEHTASGGRSVAAGAIDFWNRVESYCTAFNQNKGPFETLDPYLSAFNTESDGLSDVARLRLSFRLPLGLGVDDVQAQLQALSQGLGTLEYYGIEGPFKADKSNTLVRAFLHAIRRAGLDPKFKVKTGTSDMNIVGPIWNCPILAYGPGDSRLDHTPEEHVSLDEYLKSIQVIEQVLQRLMEN